MHFESASGGSFSSLGIDVERVPRSRDGHRKPALVVVPPWVYHENCGIGGGVLCFRLLRELASRFDIHFVSFETTANDLEGGKAALAAVCASVQLVKPPQQGAVVSRLFKLIFEGRPGQVQNSWSAELAQRLATTVARVDPCAVMFQFPEMAQYASGVPSGTRIVLDTQDVAMVSRYRELRSARGRIATIKKTIAWWTWMRYELKTYREGSALVAISDSDFGVLRSFFPGIPSYLSLPAVDIGTSQRRPISGQVCMVGNFGHPPNRDGANWLLSEVWPLVRRAVPQATLVLVGPHSPSIGPVEAALGISSRGFVDDLASVFASSEMSLVPYRFGGGIKMKALEAFAARCPVVATTIGAECLDAVDGVQIRIADGTEAYARRIVDLLSDPEAGARMSEAAHALLLQRFSWRAKIDALVTVLDGDADLVQRGESASTTVP